MQWNRVLHHVTVEVLALAQAGRDVSAVHTERAVKYEDWKRTAGVQVKVNNGAVELQLPTDDSLELILKAVPESLAEEIIMAVENAEAVPESVSEEAAQESAQEGLETAAETTAEESAEGFTEQHVDAKDIDAAEKVTMRAIASAIHRTAQRPRFVGQGEKARKEIINEADQGFLQTPLANPTIKLAVSVFGPHNTRTCTDTSTDRQACAAIDRPAPTGPRGLDCKHRGWSLLGRQIQARAQQALQDRAAEEDERNIAQRDYPSSQANTNPQAQGGRQMEGD
jgi:hypothetical protein